MYKSVQSKNQVQDSVRSFVKDFETVVPAAERRQLSTESCRAVAYLQACLVCKYQRDRHLYQLFGERSFNKAFCKKFRRDIHLFPAYQAFIRNKLGEQARKEANKNMQILLMDHAPSDLEAEYDVTSNRIKADMKQSSFKKQLDEALEKVFGDDPEQDTNASSDSSSSHNFSATETQGAAWTPEPQQVYGTTTKTPEEDSNQISEGIIDGGLLQADGDIQDTTIFLSGKPQFEEDIFFNTKQQCGNQDNLSDVDHMSSSTFDFSEPLEGSLIKDDLQFDNDNCHFQQNYGEPIQSCDQFFDSAEELAPTKLVSSTPHIQQFETLVRDNSCFDFTKCEDELFYFSESMQQPNMQYPFEGQFA